MFSSTYLEANGGAADFVDAVPSDIFIGRISVMELIVGARNKRDQKVIEEFIGFYSIKELSDAIGQEAHRCLKSYARLTAWPWPMH